MITRKQAEIALLAGSEDETFERHEIEVILDLLDAAGVDWEPPYEVGQEYTTQVPHHGLALVDKYGRVWQYSSHEGMWASAAVFSSEINNQTLVDSLSPLTIIFTA